ncbi:MAG: hypothetical protein WA966_12350 [Ornithinimicrobium sp.]
MCADPERGDIDLLRAFEPVVRFTKGEFFFPVSVSGYVERAALWSDDRQGQSHRCYAVTQLDTDELTEHCRLTQGLGHALSAVDTGAETKTTPRIPLKDRPPMLQGASRLASVGVTARAVDALNRLSLLFRGSVPGGSAARSFLIQRDHLEPERPTYYGRVVHDGPWVVCQYWFFYSFNNWRSGFGGVNEHEGDWEQVTIYLDGQGQPDPDGLPAARWVVFSAHDETGDDLRRRWDDPDLTLVQGRHPVVFAGAGSHSGAYVAGDYLITVQPPTMPSFVRAAGRAARIFTPWSATARSGSGVAIPYVDYARGDGRAVGPGEAEAWNPVVLDDTQEWVHAYRGLWGHDTRDRLGGERGPAGPRYERDGTVRQSWADPVGWSGLAKVAPNSEREQELVRSRAEQIQKRLGEVQAEVDRIRISLRTQAAGLAPGSPEVQSLQSEEHRSLQLRMEQTRLTDELARMQRGRGAGQEVADPHEHLAHRLLPMEPIRGVRGRLLSWWSVVSTPLMLCAIAAVISPVLGLSSTLFAVYSVLILMSVEGVLRGHFMAVAMRFTVAAVVLAGLYLAWLQWKAVLAVPLLFAALLVLVVNLREALRR